MCNLSLGAHGQVLHLLAEYLVWGDYSYGHEGAGGGETVGMVVPFMVMELRDIEAESELIVLDFTSVYIEIFRSLK